MWVNDLLIIFHFMTTHYILNKPSGATRRQGIHSQSGKIAEPQKDPSFLSLFFPPSTCSLPPPFFLSQLPHLFYCFILSAATALVWGHTDEHRHCTFPQEEPILVNEINIKHNFTMNLLGIALLVSPMSKNSWMSWGKIQKYNFLLVLFFSFFQLKYN